MTSPAIKDSFDSGFHFDLNLLLHHLEWEADRFSLLFVFAESSTARSLQQQRDERLRLHGRPLQVADLSSSLVESAATAVDTVIKTAIEAQAKDGAVWLELNNAADQRQLE